MVQIKKHKLPEEVLAEDEISFINILGNQLRIG
jgi:hypothetical protein